MPIRLVNVYGVCAVHFGMRQLHNNRATEQRHNQQQQNVHDWAHRIMLHKYAHNTYQYHWFRLVEHLQQFSQVPHWIRGMQQRRLLRENEIVCKFVGFILFLVFGCFFFLSKWSQQWRKFVCRYSTRIFFQ